MYAKKHIYRLVATALMWCLAVAAVAQTIRGRVLDKATGETLPTVSIYYLDAPGINTVSDGRGRFAIPLRKSRTLVFAFMGYAQERYVVTDTRELTVRMEETLQEMQAVEVTHKRKKYKRKGNPAVELMNKVIASKRNCIVDSLDNCSFTEYQRQVISMDQFRPESFASGHKQLAFLSKYASVNPLTGDTILPLLVDETVTEHKYRKNPKLESHVVTGQRNMGLTDLVATGEMTNTLVKDVFTEVNIYENDVRLFQLRFMSPISDRATSFYHYFIHDTIDWHGQRCYEVGFVPANPRDIGFSGLLHILADSTWQVAHAEINLPNASGINYVDRLRVEQTYDTIAGGVRTLMESDMLVSMSLVDFLTKFECRRISRRSGFSLAEIPVPRLQKEAKMLRRHDATRRNTAFWDKASTVSAGGGHEVHRMMDDLKQMRSFKWIRFTLQMFGENYIETRKDSSLVDIGPVKQMLGGNYVQGVRLGVGAQTTGNLSQHLFAGCRIGMGLRDKRPYGEASLTWSFLPKELQPHDFPVHNISLSYSNDALTSADRVAGHNRDNLFTVFNMNSAKHMMYQQAIRLKYEREWLKGWGIKAELMHETLKARGHLLYQPLMGSASPTLDPDANLGKLTNAQMLLALRYQPGATYIATKQRRLLANNDAPYIELSHAFAPRGLMGTNYTSNITELKTHKRFWMNSWGRMDFWVSAGMQWNKVPFPLLLMPLTNQTLLLRKQNFNLINDFEFANDHYAQLMWRWDMMGKALNRIPLIRRLGWREYIGVNVLWGMISDRNNPAATNYADNRLMHMPGQWEDGNWKQFTQAMDKNRPYAEAYIGITNIFNFFTVQYVHRLAYLDNPDVSRWGLRFMVSTSF